MRFIFPLILIACAFVAFRSFPRHDRNARRRLPWLGLLALPLAVSIGFGPFVIDHHAFPLEERRWMIVLQHAAPAAYAAVLAALLVFMRGGRIFAVAIGIAGALVSLAIAAVSITIIDPGS